MPRRSRALVIAAGCAAMIAASLTACSTSGGDSGQTTLVYWNQTADPDTQKALDAVIADFEKANPTITIKQTRYQSEKLKALAKNAFRSASTPDVAYVEVPTAREMDAAGLVQNLDTYSKKYDWTTRVTDSGRSWVTADDGHLYGLGVESEINGMLWDVTGLKSLGLTVPKTMDELVNVCQTAKAAGKIPIASGDNGAGWIWYFYLGLPLLNALGPEGEIAFAKHESGKWTDSEVEKAVKTVLVTAKNAGCFEPDMSTLDNNTAISQIESQKALGYFPAATGNLTPIQEASPNREYNITVWPEVPGGKGQYAMQGMGSAWVINKKSAHADAAAKFLDYMVQKKTAEKLVETAGFLPPVAGIDVDSLKVSGLFKQGAEQLLAPGAELGTTIDLASSDKFNDEMGRLGQEVFSDQITVDQFFTQLQAAWAADKS